MAFNLHALARGAVMAVHPEVPMVAIFCTGFLNDHGQHIMRYSDCERISAQKQTLNGDDIQLANELMQAQMSRKFFLSTMRPLTAGQQHNGEGASRLYELDTGEYWRVYTVSEDFSSVGWQQVCPSLKRVIKIGERYHVSYRHPVGGNIVTAEKDQNGAVIIYDPQTGERFTPRAYDNGVKERIRA